MTILETLDDSRLFRPTLRRRLLGRVASLSGRPVRSTIRMVELGIPEADVMELIGRETRSILDRYNIMNSRRKVAAVEKLTGALDAKPRRKLVGLRHSNGTDNGGSV